MRLLLQNVKGLTFLGTHGILSWRRGCLQVLNLYSNDGQRLVDGTYMLPSLLSGPLFAVGATIYAVTLIGAWALIGFVILLLMLPVQVGPPAYLQRLFTLPHTHTGWWRGTVVERRSLAGELSLSCARPAADG